MWPLREVMRRWSTPEDDTFAFSCGDGAAAFVVGDVGEGQGVLSTKVVNTSATCGLFFNEVETDGQGKIREYIKAGKHAGKLFPELSFSYAEECCRGALAAAGVTVDDIDLFVFFSATAWQSQFTTQVLGVDPARVFDLFPRYANISSTSIPVHLHHAAAMGRLRPGDLVLAYGHGFVGSSAAVVMRWGDVALGPMPPPSEGLQREA